MDDAKPDTARREALDEYDLFDPFEPDVFDELAEAEEATALARAETDLAAGRIVSHQEVVAWLESLMTDNPLPRPRPWLK